MPHPDDEILSLMKRVSQLEADNKHLHSEIDRLHVAYTGRLDRLHEQIESLAQTTGKERHEQPE